MTTETTTVDLVIRLRVAGSSADVATYLDPLYCLADVMAVQAGPSEYVADIASARVQAILIEGRAPTTTERN